MKNLLLTCSSTDSPTETSKWNHNLLLAMVAPEDKADKADKADRADREEATKTMTTSSTDHDQSPISPAYHSPLHHPSFPTISSPTLPIGVLIAFQQLQFSPYLPSHLAVCCDPVL